MVTRNDWKINGIALQWISSVSWKSYPEKITLHCAAYPDEYDSAREEIQRFNDLAAQTINHVDLMNGGSDLQISADGQIVMITEGDNIWQGAIEYPDFAEEGEPKKGILYTSEGTFEVDEVLEWDIVIHLFQANDPPFFILRPDFRVYPNIDYNAYNAGDNGGAITKSPGTVSEEISFNNTIKIDDKVTISTSHGSITKTFGGVYPGCDGPPVEITSILASGNNSITVSIVNISGPMSCSPLIIQDTTGKMVKVHSGFSKNGAVNEVVTLGTVTFNWDGVSPVYLANGSFQVDDKIKVTTSHGIINGTFGGVYAGCMGPALDITSILVTGTNSITTQIQNISGSMGCSPLILHATNGDSIVIHQTGFNKNNAAVNETVSLGTVDFEWDGTGHVYIIQNNNRPWTNPNNIKTSDSVNATCYNNTKNPYTTNQLILKNFGFDMPEDDTVTRVQVVIKYAANSVTRSPNFNNCKHYIQLIGSNLNISASKDFVKGGSPSSLQTMIFDTADKSLPSFNEDPAVYNNTNFRLKFKSDLDAYKTCWIDSIQIKIWYQPFYGYFNDFSVASLDDFNVTGNWSIENNALKVVTNNNMAIIETKEHYSPQKIISKITPDANLRFGFVFGYVSIDNYIMATYDQSNRWEIATVVNGVWSRKAQNLKGTTLTTNTTYDFTIEISTTGLITLKCNGVTQLSYNRGSAIPVAGVGFRAWHIGTCRFDNFKVIQSKRADNPEITGADIGTMAIVLTRDVKQIEITGSACNLPAWIEVNGERQNWKFSHCHDPGEVGGVDGEQTLLFSISPPTNIIEITTSPNYPETIEGYVAEHHRGSTLKQIKGIYS